MQDYQSHLKLNSSKLIAGVSTYTDNSVNAINSILLAITNSFVSLTIIFGIIIINYKIAFYSTIYIGFIYFLFAKIFKKIINSNSKIIAFKTQLVIKSLQEGIGSIRDLILNNNQDIYLRYFKAADRPKRKLTSTNSFLATFPRYLVEGISIFILSILVAVFSGKDQQEISIIVFLGTLAISYQKLLPAIQGAIIIG